MNDQDIDVIQAFYENAKAVEPLQADKYLLSSTMQKSIRRGKASEAVNAAKGFWLTDRTGFWRRIHITAMEDIGIGDLNAVIACLEITLLRAKRDRETDLAAALYITQRLAEATKCRIADTAYVLVERGVQYQGDRTRFARMSPEELETVISEDQDLCRKMLALWFLAGTDKFRSDLLSLRHGDRDRAEELLRDMSVPDRLKAGCLGLLYRTGWPLALFTPLLAQEIDVSAGEVIHRSFNDKTTAGIPHYALDLYTRVGKACIRYLMMSDKRFKRFSANQVGTALFHLESALTDKTLVTPFLTEIETASDFAMMQSLGLCEPEYLALCDILRETRGTMTDIKHDQLVRYRQDFDGGLL